MSVSEVLESFVNFILYFRFLVIFIHKLMNDICIACKILINKFYIKQ